MGCLVRLLPHPPTAPARQRGLYLTAFLLLLAGCAHPQIDEMPGSSREEARPRGEWILPMEGLSWGRAHLLSVFAFSQWLNPDFLKISLNGHEQTDAFFPAGTLKQGAEHTTQASVSSAQEATLVSRVQAVRGSIR